MAELQLKQFKVTYRTFSKIGNRLRNEDKVLVKAENQDQILFLIADGMGGHPYGEEAAQLAVDSILKLIAQSKNIPDRQQIKEIMHQASNRIQDTYPEGGATIGGILVVGNKAIMFWLGDVRIYLLKKNGELTTSNDHSLINKLRREQEVVSPESILKYSSVVTSYLGLDKDSLKIGFHEFSMEDGVSGLICTDGIHQNVNANLIYSLMKEEASVEQFESALEDQKIQDNHSYLIMKVSNEKPLV